MKNISWIWSFQLLLTIRRISSYLRIFLKNDKKNLESSKKFHWICCSYCTVTNGMGDISINRSEFFYTNITITSRSEINTKYKWVVYIHLYVKDYVLRSKMIITFTAFSTQTTQFSLLMNNRPKFNLLCK